MTIRPIEKSYKSNTGVPEVHEVIEVWLEELFAAVHILDTDLQGGLGNKQCRCHFIATRQC